MTTNEAEFVDYYEVLETSRNASSETIERVFRFLAKRFHPDCSAEGDSQRFTQIVEAYEVLRDPEKRAKFDSTLESQNDVKSSMVRDAGHASSDAADRHRLLTLLYSQRRKSMTNPGIGSSTLEHVMNLPMEVLEFHIWYFREKGMIDREESGTLSITAAGVDKIEATIEKQEAASLMRIAQAQGSPDVVTLASL